MIAVSCSLAGRLLFEPLDLLAQLPDPLLQLRLLGRPAHRAEEEQLALAHRRSGRPPPPLRQIGRGRRPSRPSRSASRRALRAAISHRLLLTLSKVARAVVAFEPDQEVARLHPRALLHQQSATTPPVGCWTFLMLLSTTREPEAMMAPESSVAPVQAPAPRAPPDDGADPAMWRLSERRVPAVGSAAAWACRASSCDPRGTCRVVAR